MFLHSLIFVMFILNYWYKESFMWCQLYVWIIPRTALNGRWYHALASWVYTKERLASYELCEVYAKEPASYIYVRRGSGMHDISDVKSDADKIGEFLYNCRDLHFFTQNILLR